MNTNRLPKIVTIFVALFVAGILLVVAGSSASQEVVRGVLPLVGVGMFTSALTFFLIELFHLPDRR
jgi:VIT1/CCC1 family predicted Fe2+/Mn2+ transporter